MNEFAQSDGFRFNRAGFLVGSLATIGAGLCEQAIAIAAPPAGITSTVPPQQLLNRLMAGNKRFVNNQLPRQGSLIEKREALIDTQAPFASILTCADSRVVPNFVFVQGLGDLFVERVAGNFPDDVVIGSIEYAVEHLGTRVIMVLGHQNCGAVKAVYSAIETNTPLPAHLLAIQQAMAPGIAGVVKAKGSMDQAISANVNAAVAKLRISPPIISKGAADGSLLVVGGVYHLANGEVKLVS
ncbi:MAG TPA: carbonic anhydrase [Candidatus Cybelea sp.]|jgi:carbonic anhydrase